MYNPAGLTPGLDPLICLVFSTISLEEGDIVSGSHLFPITNAVCGWRSVLIMREKVDIQWIEPWTSRMRSVRATTVPNARCIALVPGIMIRTCISSSKITFLHKQKEASYGVYDALNFADDSPYLLQNCISRSQHH